MLVIRPHADITGHKEIPRDHNAARSDESSILVCSFSLGPRLILAEAGLTQASVSKFATFPCFCLKEGLKATPCSVVLAHCEAASTG